MTSKQKKVIAAFCLCAMLLVPGQAVFAAEAESDYEIAPMMTYIVDYSIVISKSGTTVNVDAKVNGDYFDATKAKVIAELQVKNGNDWIPVGLWTDTQDDYQARVVESYDGVSGHTYRVKATVTVWEGSASETVTSYTDELTL